MSSISLANSLRITLGAGAAGNGVSMYWSDTMKNIQISRDPGDFLVAERNVGINGDSHILAENFKNTGKWYFEVDIVYEDIFGPHGSIGLAPAGGDYSSWVAGTGKTGWSYIWLGRFYKDGANLSSNPDAFSTQNTTYKLMCAADLTAGNLWFGLDGVWQAFAGGDAPDPATGTDPVFTTVSGDLYPAASVYFPDTTVTLHASASNVTYTIPLGFSAWDS